MRRDEDKPFYVLNPAEVIALIAWGEARGEGVDGQVAVMWVLKNRALAGKWFLDSGILEAALSNYHAAALKNALVHGSFIYQFSCLSEKDPNREHLIAIANNPTIAKLILVDKAWEVIRGDLADPTIGATYYYAPAVCCPAWASTFKETVVIGHHRFMKS